jgi:TatD DNase family protein
MFHGMMRQQLEFRKTITYYFMSKNMITYFDTHTHLFDTEFQNDLPQVIERAHQAGVEWMIVPATDVNTGREAIRLAERYDSVYAAVGVHPHEASKVNDAFLAEIEELSRHPKVVAIGEIGLDYHYNFSPRETQQEMFKVHLELAARRNLPVIIHTREAMVDTRKIVDEVIQLTPNWKIPSDGFPNRGVFHCFPGTAAEAQELRAMGFWVSFPGIVTFKKSSVLEVIKEIGYDKLFIETDAPYMTPVPFRGQRNEPAHVVLVGKKIAEAVGASEEDVATTTTRNARLFFGIRE